MAFIALEILLAQMEPFYASKTMSTVAASLVNVRNGHHIAVVILIAPVFCSESTNTDKCYPSLTSKTFYQIQLYDSSIHLLHDLHLKISDTDLLDEPTCLGYDTTVTGTSRYCQNFPCTNKSKKFCYYPQTPITYIILQNYTIPVKAWGVTTRSFYDFENTPHTHYCTECSFICLINGSLLRRRPPIHKLTIDICTSNSIHHNFCQIINDTYLTVFDIPQEFLTTDHKINLKIWNNGILIYENAKTCLPIDICQNIDCTFCLRYISQCTSKLDIIMGLLLIWICLLFITTIFIYLSLF
uniref:Phlebovirus_G2 domain-containing protein n=1 Tax=Heterorhabditis bacteriophora TaxID=37862 RepID=A0A1I7X2Q2_HETBA